MSMTKVCVVMVGLLVFSRTAGGAEYSGQFFEKGSKRSKLLFTSQARVSTEGSRRLQHVVFKGLDGSELVVEDTIWNDGVLQRFVVDQKQLNEHGEIELSTDTVTFRYTKDGQTKTATEKRTANLVIPGVLSDYVRDHWAAIQKNENLVVRFAVVDRLETVGFRFSKDKDVVIDGTKYVLVTMEPSEFFIRLLVKPVKIVFFENGDGILEITGRTSPKLRDGKSWSDCEAEGVFVVP